MHIADGDCSYRAGGFMQKNALNWRYLCSDLDLLNLFQELSKWFINIVAYFGLYLAV